MNPVPHPVIAAPVLPEVKMLTTRQQAILERTCTALSAICGITAIGLGGSHARGRARPDSDLDLCLLYRTAAPFDIGDIARIARELDDQGDPVIAGVGEWGPWVDGGCWLVIDGQRVDLLYRAEDKVEAVLSEAVAGRYESHFDQQPPFGYFGPTVLGEMSVVIPLVDPQGRLAELQAKTKVMPSALRQSVVQNCLWSIDFGLAAFLPKYVASGNVLAAAGCLTRFGHALVLAIFALNDRYLLNDKTALIEIGEFAVAPADFPARLESLLGTIGTTPAELGDAANELRRLFEEVRNLAGDLYRPFWSLEALTA
jgi:predicted nucleotidyltransferase